MLYAIDANVYASGLRGLIALSKHAHLSTYIIYNSAIHLLVYEQNDKCYRKEIIVEVAFICLSSFFPFSEIYMLTSLWLLLFWGKVFRAKWANLLLMFSRNIYIYIFFVVIYPTYNLERLFSFFGEKYFFFGLRWHILQDVS